MQMILVGLFKAAPRANLLNAHDQANGKWVVTSHAKGALFSDREKRTADRFDRANEARQHRGQ